jgi:HSP20 family protein
MALTRRRNRPEWPSLRQAIDELFDESFVSPREWLTLAGSETPAIDMYTTPDAVVVRAAMPGFKAEEIETTITGDMLSIHGKYRDEVKREEADYLYRELSRGELRRSITLPRGLRTDEAEATYADGILTLTIAKAEASKPLEIKVQER